MPNCSVVQDLRSSAFGSGVPHRLLGHLPPVDHTLLIPEILYRHLPKKDSDAYKFRHFITIDSTNLEARRDAERGAPEFTVYVAETQTAGRGRQGRRWLSPPAGGIYCSVLLRPASSPRENLIFTKICALAVHESLTAAIAGTARGRESKSLRIKPPNDLFLNDRKVGGILIESASLEIRTQYVVLGFGINVNQVSFPVELSDRATSLRIEYGQTFDRGRILVDVLENLQAWYRRVRACGHSEVDTSWIELTGLPSCQNQPITSHETS